MIKRMALVLSILSASTQLLAATTKGTISVTPAVVMLKGTPGQSTTQTITVTNATTEPFTFEMLAKDVLVVDGKRRFASASAMSGSISASAVFSENIVSVAPGASHQVSVTVTIPPNPTSRAVVAMFHGTNKVHRGPVNVTGSVGTLLTFVLTENVAMSAGTPVVSLPTAASNFVITQRCTNTGAEPLVASGMLAIINASGGIVGKTALPGRRLLPGEIADIRAEYGGDLAPGHYRALLTYDPGPHVVSSSIEFVVK